MLLCLIEILLEYEKPNEAKGMFLRNEKLFELHKLVVDDEILEKLDK